ncbi:RodZ domain-containing protein [Marinobacterium rhizophilum]|uniref:RodZ domain-containing protein n=1 Tax=Marinobacterium rhizophilum TaxID=420402 RepID=UPI00035CC1EE|nr:helix-turn-helix domain-containing protein [Marinobacterium rhizophilum]
MNQVSQAESESSVAQAPQLGLVQMRERQGLSLEQVAASLRLPIAQVKALEEGDYSKLPSTVFARGYLRSYARLLGLSGDDLVCEFDRNYGGEQTCASIRSISRVQPSGSSGPGVRLSMLLLVVVVVATTFWWWKTQYGHEVALTSLPEGTVAVDTADGETLVLSAGEPEAEFAIAEQVLDGGVISGQISADAESDVVALPEEPASAGAIQGEGAVSAFVAETEQTVVGGTVTDPVVVATVSVPEQGAESPVEAGATDAEVLVATGLVVHFQDDCWVTIKGATGKTLFNNLRKAGDELHIEQTGPLNVLLGRASAVSKISFDGAAVDLAPFSNKNVARLTLPLN